MIWASPGSPSWIYAITSGSSQLKMAMLTSCAITCSTLSPSGPLIEPLLPSPGSTCAQSDLIGRAAHRLTLLILCVDKPQVHCASAMVKQERHAVLQLRSRLQERPDARTGAPCSPAAAVIVQEEGGHAIPDALHMTPQRFQC